MFFNMVIYIAIRWYRYTELLIYALFITIYIPLLSVGIDLACEWKYSSCPISARLDSFWLDVGVKLFAVIS